MLAKVYREKKIVEMLCKISTGTLVSGSAFKVQIQWRFHCTCTVHAVFTNLLTTVPVYNSKGKNWQWRPSAPSVIKQYKKQW